MPQVVNSKTVLLLVDACPHPDAVASTRALNRRSPCGDRWRLHNPSCDSLTHDLIVRIEPFGIDHAQRQFAGVQWSSFCPHFATYRDDLSALPQPPPAHIGGELLRLAVQFEEPERGVYGGEVVPRHFRLASAGAVTPSVLSRFWRKVAVTQDPAMRSIVVAGRGNVPWRSGRLAP